jgi:subtilisin family serine protease
LACPVLVTEEQAEEKVPGKDTRFVLYRRGTSLASVVDMFNGARIEVRIARAGVSIASAVAMILSGGVSAGSATTQESSEAPAFAPDEIVVGYPPGTPSSERWRVRRAVPAAGYRESPGLDVIELFTGTTVGEALSGVRDMRQITFAEPNYRLELESAPNDPLYEESWSLGASNASGYRSGIDTPSVWNLTVGAGNVAVGIADSGVALGHPDLAPNLWTNPGEKGAGREANGVDDDQNGFVDDWQGWDWVDADNDPTDLNGHGTMVAGTIGALGDNGVGGSGVSWRSRMIPMRILDASGIGWTSDAAAAFSYAGGAGAKVVNASLTASVPSVAMLQAMTEASDTLFVVAAGNDASSNEVTPRYPCNFPLPNIVCVASTDEYNRLSAFSNYGPVSVDLAAPGERILTTHPDGYVEFYGTSAAAPHVSGTAALLWAQHPDATVGSIARALLDGVEPLPELQGKTVSGGRLNAAGALRQMGDDVPYDPGKPDRVSAGKGKGDEQKQSRCQRHKRHRHRPRVRRCRRR